MADKIVMVGERRFRLPFIDLIPFDEKQNQALGEAIKLAGAVKVPIVCWKEKKTSSEDVVLDGAHRCVWASKNHLDKVPKVYLSCASEEEAAAAVEELNGFRRHLVAQALHELHQSQIARMAAMRAEGDSLRAIAEEEGVSEATVRRRVSGASGGDAPERVKGKDGKTYAASIVCKRCKRIGTPVKNCDACRRERQRRADKKKKAKETKETKPARVDAFGNDLPKWVWSVYGDKFIQKAIDYLGTMVAHFWRERLAEGLMKRKKFFPFYDAKEFQDGYAQAGNTVEQLVEHLKEFRPAGVCPSCSGEGCSDCRNSGLVPRELYKKLKEKKK